MRSDLTLIDILEAVVTSEATKRVFTNNIHMGMYVIEVTYFKSEARFKL